VRLTVRRLKENRSKAQIEFRISDTGIGIDPEKLQQIFDPFVQADPSATRKFGGTGLGLTITRRLVELMSGRIDAVSEPGRGSTFRFDVTFDKNLRPQQDFAATVSAAAVDEPPSRRIRSGAHVLLAEDNPVNQFVAVKILEKLGLQVSVAGNGAEAIAALRDNTFDLILMDLQMPVMDGLEATRLIRDPATGAGNPDVPIVAMTAHAFRDNEQQCLEAGMNGYLSKPVKPEDLASVLAEQLDGTPAAAPTTRGDDAVDGSGVFDPSKLDEMLEGDEEDVEQDGAESRTPADAVTTD
jgi:CheY-like chemotaxis protein